MLVVAELNERNNGVFFGGGVSISMLNNGWGSLVKDEQCRLPLGSS
jgi:hypothetical protein